jgi:NAD(P)-dependent dehydrogenase (short-subunit alcohol dehydrogenase family)
MMTNKIAIITGSGGLGRNTAGNLARRGVDILFFTYRANQREAESLVREAEAIGRKAAGFRLDTGDVRARTSSRTTSAERKVGFGRSSPRVSG